MKTRFRIVAVLGGGGAGGRGPHTETQATVSDGIFVLGTAVSRILLYCLK